MNARYIWMKSAIATHKPCCSSWPTATISFANSSYQPAKKNLLISFIEPYEKLSLKHDICKEKAFGATFKKMETIEWKETRGSFGAEKGEIGKHKTVQTCFLLIILDCPSDERSFLQFLTNTDDLWFEERTWRWEFVYVQVHSHRRIQVFEAFKKQGEKNKAW